jgi:hypothetical protein
VKEKLPSFSETTRWRMEFKVRKWPKVNEEVAAKTIQSCVDKAFFRDLGMLNINSLKR